MICRTIYKSPLCNRSPSRLRWLPWTMRTWRPRWVFFPFFFVKFVQFKVTSSNKYLYEQALAAAEFEFILISGVDCLQPKGRPRFVNSRFHLISHPKQSTFLVCLFKLSVFVLNLDLVMCFVPASFSTALLCAFVWILRKKCAFLLFFLGAGCYKI